MTSPDVATANATAPPAADTVAVFGAGIAGLTVAHELVRIGYRVAVYEALPEAGGFFRSARDQENLPTEYSWHGFGPWYNNVFDLLKQIPFDESGSVYERALSRPIDFGIFPDDAPAEFYDHGLRSIPRMFRMSGWEWLRWSWLMLKTWGSRARTEHLYSRMNAARAWEARLGPRAARTWRSCFGPWIGSDWTKVSLHHAGQFFRKQLITRPRHAHPADGDGGPWTHGAGDGWLLLRGPSSEFWFDRWVADLARRGVRFEWRAPLRRLFFDGRSVTGAELASGATVIAARYVVATHPFAAAEILGRTPALERMPQLCCFRPLIQDGPHVQVSFRIAFGEPIRFPRKRAAVVVADSEFNLTLFAEEQVWKTGVSLGRGVKSLWTGTSCVGTVPGRVFHRPVIRCTREQFIAEVRAQILACAALNTLIKEANGGRSLSEFPIERIEVWHEWEFSPDGIGGPQPKWVTTTSTQPHLPEQATPVPNLFLAGAHTRTEADVWSIEAAVESGRRAAHAIDTRVKVIHQYTPGWLRLLGRLDDVAWRLRGPHVLDLLAWACLAVGIAAVLAFLR